MKRFICFSLAGFLLVACGEGEIASVNGRSVSQTEFDAYLAHKRIAVRNDEHKQRVLDQYLQREGLAVVIEEELLEQDAAIQAELNEIRKEIVINRYFEQFLKDKVTDEAVSNFYNNNIGEFEEKKVHVAHILLRTNRNMDEAQRQAKLTTAQEAYSKINSGMSFADAAAKYSEDAVSAKKGGDLGWVKSGTIDSAFSEKAFSMKAGEISEPFETPFGFHILTVIEEPQVTRRPFESVKGEIRYRLRNQAKDAEMERLASEIKIKKRD